MEKHPTPVIVSATRTPIGSFGGALKAVSAVELGATVIREALARAKVAPEDVEETIMGMVLQAGVGQAPARQAAIRAGIPTSSSAMTINKVCSSGLKAVMLGGQLIVLGENKIIVAGGMENMNQAPYYLDKAREGYRLGNGTIVDGMVNDGLWDPYKNCHMGNCAELCAREKKVSREEQDAYATESYTRAQNAQKAGKFKPEIIPVTIKQRKAETVVTVNDGQTLFIGGLLQSEDTKVVRQIPLISKIPIIGELFKRKEFQTGQSELVILVTPEIVEMAAANRQATEQNQ